MRKSLICLALAASVVSVNIQAQVVEPSGGSKSSQLAATGAANAPIIVAGAMAVGIGAGLVSNTNGKSPPRKVVPPIDPPVLTCSGDDKLVDGVCINSSVEVTVTGTGTATSTITVPVTSTYAPTS